MSTKTLQAALVWLLAFAVCPVFSQNQITGAVADAKKSALPGASVLLMNAKDSSLFKGQLSSDDGRFQLADVPAGVFFLKVSMLGFADFLGQNFDLGGTAGAAKNFPEIELAENSAQLAEVQIVAKKPFFEQKIDRVVVNVAGSATNAGSNALEVLRRSPGVLVNRQSNSLSIAGKNGVLIMINGKISRMPPDAILQMLEGTNADNIERIEIIHTPPANFDADGSAGIINIVMKQSADAGLSGGYSLAAGYGRGGKAATGVYFNYRAGKLNVFGNHDFQFTRSSEITTNYRGVERGGQFLETDGISRRYPDLGIHNARLGADFQVSPKTVVGVVGTFFNRYWDMTAKNAIDYRTNGATDSLGTMQTQEINHWQSATANLNFSHEISKTKTVSADVDYVYYEIKNPSDYQIGQRLSDGTLVDTSQLRVGKVNPISIWVGKLDYAQNFGKNTRLETGVKTSMSQFDNDVRVENFRQNSWKTDSALTSRAKLQEDVAAAYATVSFKITPKMDAKVGLRYEYTTTKLASATEHLLDRKYGSLFPTAYLAYAFSETQSANLSYSRRYARPGFTQLAPYLIFFDPTTVQSGNPALQPVFVDAVRLSYIFGGLTWATEYNRASPSIQDIPVIDLARNTQVQRPENIGEVHTVFSFFAFPKDITKWWRQQSTLYLVWSQFNYALNGQSGSIDSRFTGIEHSQSFTFGRGWSADLSAFFVTPNYNGLYRARANGQVSVGLRKNLGERWGDLTFNVNDIFESSNYYTNVNEPELNLRVGQSWQQAERVFKVSWSNKFGNRKLRDARQRERGAADELRRL